MDHREQRIQLCLIMRGVQLLIHHRMTLEVRTGSGGNNVISLILLVQWNESARGDIGGHDDVLHDEGHHEVYLPLPREWGKF